MSKQEEVKTKEEEVKITATDTTPTKKEGEFKIKSAKKLKNLGEEKIPDIIKVDLSKHKRQMIAMLLSKSKKTVATAKKWLKKYGPPTKE
mgnify:CR=1 FL=1